MSNVRFGERYFATRERLAQLDRALVALANDVACDLPRPEELEAAHRRLDSPFVFLVIGEVNSGKSSLFNALAAQEICPANSLPETRRVMIHRHGFTPESREIDDLTHEQRHPIDFLRDFTLIDTPGTDSRIEGAKEATIAQVPAADLIFCVFPVTNPWGAATWNWIDSLPPDSLNRTVFVVQQCDKRQPQDLPVILGHLADLSIKRLGQTRPMFAISSRLAIEAAAMGTQGSDRWKNSGIGPLEDFISGNVCLSPLRWQALLTVREHTARRLTSVEDRIERQSRALLQHNLFIDSIEREIDGMRKSFVQRLPSHLLEVAEVFQAEAVWTTHELRRRLGALRSFQRLLVGDTIGKWVEATLIQRLKSAVESVAEKDGDEVASVCREHWRNLGKRVREEMGLDLDVAQPIGEILDAARLRFIHCLGEAAGQGIGGLRVRSPLEKDLRRRNSSLKAFLASALVGVTIGASCGALKFHLASAIAFGIAALFWLGGIWVAWITRKMITQEFQQRLLNTCESFASTLHQDYADALQRVFRDYAATLEKARDHLTRERLSVEPRQRRWQELFLTLKTIEQDF